MKEVVLENPLIKRKPGECPNCGYPLSVLEREVTDTTLTNEGLPANCSVVQYKCIGYCTHCGATYPDILHKGLFFDVRSLHDLIIYNTKTKGE